MNPVPRLVTAALVSGALCACAARPMRPEETSRPFLRAQICFVGINERAKSRAVVERYLRRIWKRLWHAYQADRRNFPTPIVLRACLSDEGVVEVVTTHVSGGSASLDAAAEDLLRRASPFGRAPAEVAGASLELTLRARSPVLP